MVSWPYQSAIQSADRTLGSDDANNAMATTNVVANRDGSVLERLEALQTLTEAVATKTVTFTAAAYEVSTAVAVFTVTGNVKARAYGVVSTAIQADTGNDGTISLGVEDNVAILCPVVTANETNFAIGDVWGTATTTKEADVILNTGGWVVIGAGEDIEINVLTEDITGGVIDLYCEWVPLSSGASVVAV
jgi:hypothetical protein